MYGDVEPALFVILVARCFVPRFDAADDLSGDSSASSQIQLLSDGKNKTVASCGTTLASKNPFYAGSKLNMIIIRTSQRRYPILSLTCTPQMIKKFFFDENLS